MGGPSQEVKVSKIRYVARQRWVCVVLFGLVVSFGAMQPRATFAQDSKSVNPDADRYVLPPESIERLFETDKNYVTLNYMSPDGDHFVVPWVTELSTRDLMSRETYRLAELELRPQTDRLWHLDTYGIYGLRFYSLSKKRFTEVDLPEGAFVSDLTWSPDGAQIAFLAHLTVGTEAWVADPSTGDARSLGSERVLATIGTNARGQGTQPSNMLQWTPEGTVLTLIVPSDRGAESPRNPIPTGPVVRRTRAEPTPTPTYPNLLRDPHDEFLFEHYTRSQLVEFVEGGTARLIGDPAMFESISVSPDGRHVLATVIERPFSFRTAYRGFPRRTFIMDKQGAVLTTLNERPLQEGRNSPNSTRGSEPRAFAWRPDGAGLSFLFREGEDDEQSDRVMLLAAPFDMDPAQVVAEPEDRINSITYTMDGSGAFGSMSKDGKTGLAYWELDSTLNPLRLLVDFHETDDPVGQPGNVWAARTGNGLSFAPISSDGSATYLSGSGVKSDFRPQPFVDRVSLADGSSQPVF